MSVPRMRMAAGVLAEIKAVDPGTHITLHYIRSIIKQEKVPVVRAGSKKLVDVDKVLEYIAHGDQEAVPEEPGKVRRVQE